MDVEVIRQPSRVKEVNGDVVIASPNGEARKAQVGENINIGEMIITAQGGTLVLEDVSETLFIDENCVSCIEPGDGFGWATAPVSGDIQVDDALLGEGALSGDELAAIQEAILAGADPTAILEATAAGAGTSGSANGGFITIAYNNPEVLASTFFETAGFNAQAQSETQDTGRRFQFSPGGESVAATLSEGSLSLGTYPATIVSSTLIAAGDLTLDPESFVPETSSIAALLTELNSDITSNGGDVLFSYNDSQNAIIGVNEQGEVLRIDINAANIGRDINLEITTTLSQPIDHLPSVAGGLVAFNEDKITINIEIQGADTLGNLLRSPISVSTAISDGEVPTLSPIDGKTALESSLATGTEAGSVSPIVTGSIAGQLGSDQVVGVRLDVEAFNQSQQTNGLTAAGQIVTLEANPSQPGEYVGFVIQGEERVDVFSLTIESVSNLSSGGFEAEYQFELLAPLDHSEQGKDDVLVSLPFFAIDSDNDTTANSNLVITVVDDVPLVSDAKIVVTEPDVQYGNESQPITLISASGAEQGVVTQFTFDGGDPIPLVDGQSEYLVTDGKVIVSADGTLSFAPDRNIDHHSANDVVSHTLVATIEDGDGDVLTSTVAIDIRDGNDPVITQIETAQVSESGLTGGTQAGQAAVQDSGKITIDVGSDDIAALTLDIAGFTEQSTLKAQGQTVRLIEDSDVPGQYLGVITVDGQEVPVFEVALDQATLKDYTFTLLRPLDHSGDNDESLVINLPVVAVDSDGDESASVNLAITVNDDIQTVVDGEIKVTEPDTQYDNESQPITLISASGAEQGEVTQFTFDGGDPITLVDGQSEYAVTDGKVIVSADGTLSFAPDRNIDHSASDVVSHTLVATIEDGDGDVLTSTVAIDITDGNDPVITQIETAQVSESGLTGGTQAGQTTVQDSGKITIDVGSDDIAALTLDLARFTEQSTLKAQGQTVRLIEDSDVPGQYLGVITVDGQEVPVFEVALDQATLKDYTFTLLRPLDHSGDNDESLVINLPVVAVDSDGDESASVNLAITVNDDIQTVVDGEIKVTEPDTQYDNESQPITLISASGAEQGVVTQFTFDGGDPIPLVDGQSEYLVTDGKVIVSADGTLSFAPDRNIDHHSASDVVSHTLVATIEDGDGDVLTSTVTIDIRDGNDPIITQIETAQVSESGLTGGTQAGQAAVQDSGKITIDVGSDDIAALTLDITRFTEQSTLKAQGQTVRLIEDSDVPGQYLGVITVDGQEVPVFEVALDQATLKDYTFTLLRPLDHSGDNDESLVINLPVVAVDSDGDESASVNLAITVNDDIQTVVDGEIKVTEPDTQYDNESQPITLISASGAEQGVVTQFTFDGGDPIPLVDGQSEYVVTDGKVIVSADGTLSFAPDRNIDHSASDVVSHTLVATIKDGDGDVLTSTVTIDIRDGNDPIITQIETAQVSESGLTGGTQAGQTTVQDSGQITIDVGSDDIAALTLDIAGFTEQSTLKAQGQTVRLIEDSDVPGQYLGVITVDGQEVPVFEVALDQVTLKDYTFTLLRPLDHSGDNDESLVINLPVIAVDSDGDDSVSVNLAITVNDDIQTVVDGEIKVTEPDTQYDNESQPITLISASGAEQGVVTQFTFDGGDAITLVEGKNEYLVTDGKVIVSADGTLSFAPDRNIDHSASDVVSHTLVATIEDGDGDVLTSTVTIDIKDGNDPIITQIETAQVSESGLTGGTQAGQTTVQDSGQITIDVGSDDIAALTLDIAGFTEHSTLKAQGQTVRLIEDSDVPGQYLGVITVDGQEVPVFEVALDQVTLKDYTFTLLRPLDHSGDNDESLVINLPVIAVDSDGDDSVSVNLAITVNDDIQTVVDGEIKVTEPDTQYDNESQPITLISASGAEQGEVTQFTFDGGDPITLVDGQSEYAVTDGKVIVSADGTLSFAPDRNIDHSASDVVSHTLVATIEDGDGDVLTSTVTIDIRDGNDPIITQIETAQVSESGLTGGTQAGQTTVQDSGQITIDVGSDDIAALTLDITRFTEQSTLKAQGQTVRLIEDSDVPGQYLGVITVDGQEVPVFEVALDQVTLKDYTFTLLRPLDHSGDNDESLVINLPVVAVDSDGDESASVNLAITVNDDIQTVVDGEIKVTEPDTQYDNESQPITLISASGAEQGEVTQFTFDGGDPITLVDGQSEYAVTDGKVIVSADGTLSFAPDRNIDHSASDVVSHTLVATIEDGDGDVLTSTVAIDITDGNDPVITQIETAQVSESGLTGGTQAGQTTVQDSGKITIDVGSDDIAALTLDLARFTEQSTLKAQGQTVRLIEDSDVPGQYLGVITVDGQEVPVFEVALDQVTLKDYTFTLLRPLDHSGDNDESLVINLPVIAVDSDGDDSVSVNLAITVNDDIQTVVDGEIKVTEPDTQYDNESQPITLISASGAEQGVVTQFTFDGGDSIPLVDGQSEYLVTDGKVIVSADGTLSFAPDRNIDHHSANGVVSHTLVATIEDGDGDVLTSTVTIDIKDGNDPVITQIETAQVSESGLTGGTQAGQAAVQDSGKITIDVGSDDIAALTLDITGFTEQSTLKAQGQTVRLIEDSDVPGQYLGVITVDGQEVPVFEVVLDQVTLKDYTFTLLRPLDHSGDNDESLVINLPVIAVDSDGDDSVSVNLAITVNDDIQTVVDGEIKVTEPDTQYDNESQPITLISASGAEQGVVTQFTFDGGDPIPLVDGQSEYLVTDGKVIVSADGTLSFAPDRNIDHHSASDVVSHTLVATIEDGDGDVLTSTVAIDITDGNDPIITQIETAQVSESGLTGGTQAGQTTVQDSGKITIDVGSDDIAALTLDLARFTEQSTLKAQGQTVRLIEDSDVPGQYLGVITVDGQEVPVFEVALVQATLKDYTFTLLRPLDHSGDNDESLVINLPLVAVDSDGDESASVNLAITVNDDIQTVVDGEIKVTEPDTQYDNESQPITLISASGAEQGVVTQFTFDGGDPITLVDGQSEYVVTDGKVIVSADGTLWFAPDRNIDHSASDVVSHTLVATIKDGDGDVLTSTVAIDIEDGNLPVITQVSGGSVFEAGLSSGSGGENTNLDVRGTVTMTTGSDDIAKLAFDLEQFNDLNNEGIYASGQRIRVEEKSAEPGSYVGYIELDGEKLPIFELDLGQPSLSDYHFTLLANIDHTVQGLDNQIIALPIVAIDADGDASSSADIEISVTDDIASIDGLSSTSEWNVEEANIEGSGAWVEGQLEYTQGADGVVSFALSNLAQTQSGLTSGGTPVVIQLIEGADGTTSYQGIANQQPVFTLVLGDDGSYRYQQLRALDHAEDSNVLTIPFDVVAVDGDGDRSSAFRLGINVADDAPTLSGWSGGNAVDEDDIESIGSDQSESSRVSGQFAVDDGVDGVTEYRLMDADAILASVSSGEDALVWQDVINTGSTWSYTAVTATNATPVFRIIFDTQDDSYAFELLGPIDHPVATSEDDVTLYFTVAAVDYDHDASNVLTLPIVITDDIPTLADQSITKVEGSGFGRTSVNFFDQITDQGADRAELTRLEGGVSGDGNPIVFRVSANTYESAIELSSGQQTVRVFEQLGGDDAPRELGELRINSDGLVQFKANGYLDHDGDDITFSVHAIATDGDDDIDQATLDVTITDRNARTINLNVTTFEDAGRDASIVYAAGDEPERENINDNQSELDNAPAKLSVQVNLYDVDNDESIGALTIIGGNYSGTFYYQDSTGVFHAIKQDTDGKLRLDGSELVQSQAQDGNNVIATIDNLYFVPDRNLATNGNMTVRYSLDILNGTEVDHSVSGRILIDVQSVADIAVWDEANSIDHYEVLEDDSNITLTLHAQTQDTSAPETITYELRAVTGDFELLDKDGQPLTANSDGVYLVSSSDINSIQIDPAKHFSGQIQLSVVAISEEEVNPYIVGSVDKSTARSEAKTITIDVAPHADTGTLKVSRIRINEDNIADPDNTDLQGNRDPLTLDEVIEMLPSADADGSEVLFVRIANITEGASLAWVGTGDSPIVEINVDGVTYQEIPYAVISQVEVVPAAHSNEDFRFEVTGVMRDCASLSDDATLSATHDAYIGPKVVNVEVKGVADVPILNDEFDSGWVAVTDNGQMRIETTIEESQNASNFAQLDFEVISGERAQALTDNSETLSVILSNIPQGVVIEDTDGSVIDLNFIGYVNGQPSYEANITGAINDSGIVIRPVDSSTQNIDITATIVVTENDGHSLSFDTDIRVNVAPVIDASDQYTNRSVGNEDSAINIDWHPKGSDYIDSDEHFTSITITGIPSGAMINVNNSDVSVDVTQDANGVSTLVVTPNGLSHEAFTQVALEADFIQLTPAKDASTNFTLSTSVEIEERDVEYTSDDIVGEGGRVSEILTGSIDVVVRPVVEPQDENNGLRLSNEQGVVFEPLSLTGDGQLNYVPIVATSGAITFTTNQDNPDLNDEVIISYQETDNSSVELVSQVVLELSYVPDPNNPLKDLTLPDSVLDQLLVTGATYEGNGRWVITDESNFSVKAPEGLNFGDIDLTGTNELQMTLHTQVVDPGDIDANGELLEPNESSTGAQRSTSVVIAFAKQIIPGDEVAAEIAITDDQIVTAQEDTVVNLGQQMTTLSVLSLSGAIDGSPDEVTLVFEPSVEIGGVVYPITIQGGDVDFVNGKFVYQTQYNDGALGSIDGLSLVLPNDYSGDFLLPFTVISKDTTSGDENVASASVIVQVAPVADVESGNSAKPSFSIDVLGSLDEDMSAIDADNNGQSDAIGYEDSYIQLAVTHAIADQLNGESEGGQETLNQVMLTLANSNVGAFYQVVDDGTGGQVYQWVGTSVSFDQQAINDGALDTLLFKPALNYPSADGNNQVVVNISGEVVDSAVFNQSPSTGEATDSQTFTTSVSFEVMPVVDDVIVSGPGNSAETIEIEGNEDELIALSASGPIDIALTDDDGSEQFVSIKLTGVPEGFLLLADADSDYSVKNNGDGVWSVRLPSAQMTHVDLSGISLQAPKDFSGTVEFNLTVFTQESLLGVPTEVTAPLPKFVVTVNPIGDDVDLDSTDRIEGLEGDNIDIEVDASVIDNVYSASSVSGVNENGPETLRVTVTDVPEGASIYYPDGVTLAQFDDATQTWVLNINAQHLDKIVFNSGDRNSDSQSATAIDKPLTVKVQSVDSDAQGVEVLGTPAEFSVMLLIDAVNDQPRFVNVLDVDTLEDTSVALNTLQIDDIDSTLDDPDAMYHLTLSVDKGSLLVLSDAELVYGLITVQGSDGQWILEGKLANINAALAASVVVYQPADNANDLNSGGPALVTAEVNDLGNFGLVDDTNASTSQSAQASFAIRVTEVNDQPVAASLDLGTMSEEGSIVISAQSLIDASSDIDGDTLKVINLQLMEGVGNLVASSDGLSWTFTAGENYSGPVRFSYTIEDNGQTQGNDDFLQDTAELQLHVQGVSDIPTLTIAPENEAIKHITASQSVSNQGIALLGIVAALTDSSEELSLLIEGVPEGAVLSSDSGTVVNESGDWYASADAINSLQIQNVSLGEYSLTLTAVSTEIEEGIGSDSAFSEPIELSLTVVEEASDIDGSSQTRPQWIIAGDQDTQLVGGSGDDIIVSGLGSDILTGGPGMDTFVWNSIEDGAADTVTDLNIAEGDRIDLRELLPELKANQVDMDVLLSHVNARLVDDDDIELEIHPEGENGARQTVTLKDLGQQISFAEMDSSQIVSTLIERNVIMHD